MEKILVALDTKHGAWAALSHACSLAERMDVELYVLLVHPSSKEKQNSAEFALEAAIKSRLELLLEAAKNKGIRINYFVSEGTYEEEIIQFVNHYRIGLLVCETTGSAARISAKEALFLRALRHRLRCKLEVVAAGKAPLLAENLPPMT
nr:universal stress protein [uncultured Desulfobulbus sp.]